MSLFKTLSLTILLFTISFQGFRIAQGSEVETVESQSSSNKSVSTTDENSPPQRLGGYSVSFSGDDLKRSRVLQKHVQRSRSFSDSNRNFQRVTTIFDVKSDEFGSPQTGSSHSDSKERQKDDYEDIRSTLVMLQYILLATAGIVFVSVILYSIYYIRLIREIYAQKELRAE